MEHHKDISMHSASIAQETLLLKFDRYISRTATFENKGKDTIDIPISDLTRLKEYLGLLFDKNTVWITR